MKAFRVTRRALEGGKRRLGGPLEQRPCRQPRKSRSSHGNKLDPRTRDSKHHTFGALRRGLHLWPSALGARRLHSQLIEAMVEKQYIKERGVTAMYKVYPDKSGRKPKVKYYILK